MEIISHIVDKELIFISAIIVHKGVAIRALYSPEEDSILFFNGALNAYIKAIEAKPTIWRSISHKEAPRRIIWGQRGAKEVTIRVKEGAIGALRGDLLRLYLGK